MKHIKHINEGFNQDDYYVNISDDEYYKLSYDTDDNKDIFNSKEVDFFNRLTIGHWEKELGRYIYGQSFISTTEEFDDSYKVNIIKNQMINYITKLKDSYYLVNCYDCYRTFLSPMKYKCDQFEGLVRLLKDKGIIK